MYESAEIKNPIALKYVKHIYHLKETIYTEEKGLVTPDDATTISALFLLYASVCTVKQCYELASSLYEKAKSVHSKEDDLERIFECNKNEARWFTDKLHASMSYHPSETTGTGSRLHHVVECLLGITLRRKNIIKILCKNKEFKKELMKIVTGDKP